MRYVPQKGFTLIETLVAISILVIAIAGPMTMAARGLQSSYHAKNQLVAVHLAQEAIEITRMMRDEYALENSNASSGWFNTSVVDDSCTTAEGCGVDGRDRNFFPCGTSPSTACVLRYDSSPEAGDRGIYTDDTTGTSDSLFTRKLFITGTSDEAVVTVKVSWRSNLFNAEKEIVLQSRIFDSYR